MPRKLSSSGVGSPAKKGSVKTSRPSHPARPVRRAGWAGKTLRQLVEELGPLLPRELRSYRAAPRGKLRRLPAYLREEICRRFYDGQLSPQILPWLNSHPEAVPILQAGFGKSWRVTAQNLSELRVREYPHWLLLREREEAARALAVPQGDASASPVPPDPNPARDKTRRDAE